MGLVPFVALRFGFLLERAEDVFFAGLDRRGDGQAILLFLGPMLPPEKIFTLITELIIKKDLVP
jgi:hypothetical protein